MLWYFSNSQDIDMEWSIIENLHKNIHEAVMKAKTWVSFKPVSHEKYSWSKLNCAIKMSLGYEPF